MLSKSTSAVGILACIGLCLSTITVGRAQDVVDPSKGRKFSQGLCAECHGVLPDEVISPRFNIASFKRISNTPGMTEQALSIWLTTSHSTMPNFILEAEDRRNVVAYNASLKDK